MAETTPEQPPMTRRPRRESRRTHLDASAVPVERALLERADHLESEDGRQAALVEARRIARMAGVVHLAGHEEVLIFALGQGMAAEFRALAEALHWY